LINATKTKDLEDHLTQSSSPLYITLMTAPIDEYHTIEGTHQYRIKIKGSVFLAIARPVESAAEGDTILTEWWKIHYDATHIGLGRRLAPPPDGEERFDDDGEPHGTTGPPILRAITGADLWGVQVGVVRWYGGTKLGTGGLTRAYGGAAREVIQQATRKKIEILRTVVVTISNNWIGTVYTIVDKQQGRPQTPEYVQTGIRLTIDVLNSRADMLAEALFDGTNGQAKIEVAEEPTDRSF